MGGNAVAHVNFRGEARAALEFYRSVFGGELTVATYGDFGMPQDAPGALAGEATRENGLTSTTEKFFLSVGGDSMAA